MLTARVFAWSAVAVFGVALLCSVPARAAGNETKIAIIDLQKVADAPRIKRHIQEFEEVRKTYEAKVQALGQNMLLSQEEAIELIDLKFKEKPTEGDAARAKLLQDKQKALDAELTNLQQTAELNETQKARQKELQGTFDKSKAAGTQKANDYSVILQKKKAEVDGKIETDILQAIKTYALAKAYTVVCDKQVVLFGGTDITDDVIKKLD